MYLHRYWSELCQLHYVAASCKNCMCCIVERLGVQIKWTLLLFSVWSEDCCHFPWSVRTWLEMDGQTQFTSIFFSLPCSIISCLYEMLIDMAAVIKSLQLLMFCPKSMPFTYRTALFQHGFNCGSSTKLRWGYLSRAHDARVRTVPPFLVAWTEWFCCMVLFAALCIFSVGFMMGVMVASSLHSIDMNHRPFLNHTRIMIGGVVLLKPYHCHPFIL